MRLTHLWSAMRKNALDLLGIPAALVLFWLSGVVIGWIAPRAVLFDPGVIQDVSVVVLHVVCAHIIARIGAVSNVNFFVHKPQTNPIAAWDSDRFWLYVLYYLGYCILACAL